MKILLGLNVTNGDKNGMALCLKQANAFKAEVTILGSLMIGDKSQAFDSKTQKDAEKKLAEARKYFEDAGISCTTELMVRGKDPGEDIVDYAKKNQVDLIIVGVRLKSRVGKFLMGSTAQYVVLKASCPVLTFKV